MFPDGTLLSAGGHEIKRWDTQYKCREIKKLPGKFNLFSKSNIRLFENLNKYFKAL